MKLRWIAWIFLALAVLSIAALFELALLPIVIAENATWQPVPVRYSWDFGMSHFCIENSQCLLHVQGNPAYDGLTDRWFTQTDPTQWPKCINNTQFILDYQCENGNWTTRTKHLALQLLSFAGATSSTNFTLFCDSYRRVLNQYKYELPTGVVEQYLGQFCTISGKPVPCVNSLCVLKTPLVVAVGATLNAPVSDASKSFLIALEKSSTICNSVSSASTVFMQCGSEPVWYNPALQGVIYLPAGALGAPSSGIDVEITAPVSSMNSYVLSVLHNPTNPALNFNYFGKTRLFNHLYAAQNGNRAIFGFLETGIFQDGPPPMDYIGVRYTGIDLGASPCLDIVKKYDDKAFCENQTGTGFNVIARHRPGQGVSPIVGAWPALTGKLRP